MTAFAAVILAALGLTLTAGHAAACGDGAPSWQARKLNKSGPSDGLGHWRLVAPGSMPSSGSVGLQFATSLSPGTTSFFSSPGLPVLKFTRDGKSVSVKTTGLDVSVDSGPTDFASPCVTIVLKGNVIPPSR